MFQALLFPLRWLDAFIQKRFDAVCFFLMRRFGWRKSHIRYSLYALLTTSSAAQYVMGFVWGRRDPISVVYTIMIIALFVSVQNGHRRQDEAAEASPGTMPSTDSDMLKNSAVFKLMLAAALVYFALRFDVPSEAQIKLGWTASQTKFVSAGALGFYLALLLLEYLIRTPMNPPAEKARDAVLGPKPTPSAS